LIDGAVHAASCTALFFISSNNKILFISQILIFFIDLFSIMTLSLVIGHW